MQYNKNGKSKISGGVKMKEKYSVFLGNVGSCSDRYCTAYGRTYSWEELFERAASIPYLSGVDLVLTPELLESFENIRGLLKASGLKPVSLAVDHFTQAKWKQGTLSSVNPSVRKEAIQDTMRAMDLAAEIGCNLVTVWPGQDGYDYLFQADYIRERTLFADGIREACRHRPDIRLSLEYKAKEPRCHCYVNSTAATLLMIQEIGEKNCGAVLDYGHALLGYENPAEAVAMLAKYGNRLFHVHINDNYRLWDDDMIVGSVHTLEYLEFFYWLRRTGYDGWMTIDQYPYREDGQEAVAESAAWLYTLEQKMEQMNSEIIEDVLRKKDGIAASRLMRRILFPEEELNGQKAVQKTRR